MDMKHNPLDVMPSMCKTCPFRIGNHQLATKLIKKVLTTSNHLCHSNNIKVCRGSRDIQLKFFHHCGVLSEPTDDGYAQALNSLSS